VFGCLVSTLVDVEYINLIQVAGVGSSKLCHFILMIFIHFQAFAGSAKLEHLLIEAPFYFLNCIEDHPHSHFFLWCSSSLLA
jgi:hypothetical protein